MGICCRWTFSTAIAPHYHSFQPTISRTRHSSSSYGLRSRNTETPNPRTEPTSEYLNIEELLHMRIKEAEWQILILNQDRAKVYAQRMVVSWVAGEKLEDDQWFGTFWTLKKSLAVAHKRTEISKIIRRENGARISRRDVGQERTGLNARVQVLECTCYI